jgi:hypothetical protein
LTGKSREAAASPEQAVGFAVSKTREGSDLQAQMQRLLRRRNYVPYLMIFNIGVEELPKCNVQFAMHEVVGCLGANLLGCLVELFSLRARNDVRGSLRGLFVHRPSVGETKSDRPPTV